MTRLIVFLSVLAGFVLILFLNNYRTLPIDNSKFELKKEQTAPVSHAAEAAPVGK